MSARKFRMIEGGRMIRVTVARTAFVGVLLAAFAFASNKTSHTYQKGTISGWENRIALWGEGFFGELGQGVPYEVTVFDLEGADTIYMIDSCGAFQAGRFGIGQAVDYRLDGDRLYIRRDNGKEYKCKIDGQRTLPTVANGASSGKP